MVERVARVLCIATGDDPDHLAAVMDAGVRLHRFGVQDEAKYLWQYRVKEARAAIEAMREPTEAMCKAGGDLHTHEQACATDYGFEADNEAMGRVFETMIDAALK